MGQGVIGGAERVFRAVTSLYETVTVGVCAYTFVPTRVMHNIKSNVNYGLWAMMCQCRFINCNECATLVRDAANGEGCAGVGPGGVWEISPFSA